MPGGAAGGQDGMQGGIKHASQSRQATVLLRTSMVMGLFFLQAHSFPRQQAY